MNKKLITPRFIFILSVILFGAFMRLVPHWPNFTPIAAIALFGGAYLNRKYLAYFVPIAALFISDIIIGFHGTMIAVYLCFAITVTIGLVIRSRLSAGTIVLGSLSSSVLFFLITNFAAWLGNPLYPQNFTGLMESYLAGLVFFNNSSIGISFFVNELLGGLFYNLLFFGAFYLAKVRFPILSKA